MSQLVFTWVVTPGKTVTLGFASGGQVVGMTGVPGQTVQQGQVLATLNKRLRQAQMASVPMGDADGISDSSPTDG